MVKLSVSMEIQRLTEANAEAIATWRYTGRYSTYDVREILTPSRGYWAVTSETELVGYCCFGPEGRPPGIDEEEGTLDVGYGIRPDLVGRGLGAAFVAAILDFGLAKFTPKRFRLLILGWNERSRRVAETLGFEQERMASSAERDFRVMVRPARWQRNELPAPNCSRSSWLATVDERWPKAT
jgi:[ribosomal protein S18]-alanine N-acetyltransferase